MSSIARARIDYPTDLTEQTVCYWWDRSWRSWGIALYTAEGDQVGEAWWVSGRDDALRIAQERATEFGCGFCKLRAAG